MTVNRVLAVFHLRAAAEAAAPEPRAKAVQAEMDSHLLILDLVVITDLPAALYGGSLG